MEIQRCQMFGDIISQGYYLQFLQANEQVSKSISNCVSK